MFPQTVKRNIFIVCGVDKWPPFLESANFN